MMRVLSECGRIWYGAVTSNTSLPLRGIEMILLGLLAALFLAGTLYIEAPVGTVLACSVCVPLAIAGAMLWMRYVAGAVRQNSPAHAALVPRLNRRLRQAAVLAFAAAMLPVLAGATAVPYGMGLVALCAAGLILFGIGRGGVQQAMLVVGAGSMALVFSGPTVWSFMLQPAVLAGCFLLIGLLGWYGLHAVFPAAGERHFRLFQLQHRSIAQGTSLKDYTKVQQSSGACRPLYRWMLARDIAGGKAERLLLHAMGPGGHRHDWMLPVAMLLGFAALGKLASHWFPLIGNFMAHSPLVPAVMIGMIAPFASAIRWSPKIESTPAEQALVRLAPRCPSSQRLNAVLGRQLLRISLTEWLVGVLAVVGVSAWWGASPATLMAELAFISAALALAGAPLRNLARKQSAPAWRSYALGVVVLLLAGGGYASAGQPWQWAALTAATVVVSCLIVSTRWRTFMASPVAFPAGRMG